MLRFDKAISLKLLSWFIPGLMALLLVFLLNTFFFKVVIIPSYDMSPNYSQGDWVLLYKTNRFKINQIIVYRNQLNDSSETKNYYFYQRLVALPGDTLLIDNGNVFVNSHPENPSSEYLHNYHIKTKPEKDSLFWIKYKFEEGGKISDEHDYSYSLNNEQAKQIAAAPEVLLIEKNIEKSGYRDEMIYTNDTVHKWNKHNFGYLYIPKKSDKIKIDTGNVFQYKKLIESESRMKIEIRNDSVFLNKNHIKEFVVKENYYFVLGDNRDNAMDSRYFGLIPEKNIIGRITYRIYSSTKK